MTLRDSNENETGVQSTALGLRKHDYFQRSIPLC